MHPRLGLTCISEYLKLQNKNLHYRTATLGSIRGCSVDFVHEKIYNLVKHNLEILKLTVQHCLDNNIEHYRITSGVVPLATVNFPGIGVIYKSMCSEDNFKLLFQSAENFITKALSNGMTFSTHPGQFVSLASDRAHVIENSILELEYHGWLHDTLGLLQSESNPINIHLNRSYGNKDDIKKSFYSAFNKLSNSVSSRLVLENEDKGVWNCKNLYDTFSNHFALTYDNLHDKCNPSNDGVNYHDKFADTWCESNPIFHYSEGKHARSRSHSDWITLPCKFNFHKGITYEIEVKNKDLAILSLWQQQNQLNHL